MLFFGFLYNTTIVPKTRIVSIMLLKSKYHIPIPNENNIITASIPLHIIIDILLLLFAYQQIKASIGVIKVIIYHIII